MSESFLCSRSTSCIVPMIHKKSYRYYNHPVLTHGFMKNLPRIVLLVITSVLLAASASVGVYAQTRDAIFSNIQVSPKIYYSNTLWINVTVRNDNAGTLWATLLYQAYLDGVYWYSSSPQTIWRFGATYTWNYSQTGLSSGTHSLQFYLYWNNNGNLVLEDVSAVSGILVVNLFPSNWQSQPSPLSLQRGKNTPSTLTVSFSNGGNDIMYSPTVSVTNSMGLTISPTSQALSNLSPGASTTLGFSVSAPSSMSAGSYTVSFAVTFQDFLGRSYSQPESAPTSVVPLSTNLALTAPTTAQLGDSIAISAKLLDGNGNPVSGQSISFSVGGQMIGSSTTDFSGTASVTYTVSLTSGTYTIIASYLGSTNYGSSSTTGTLLINPLFLTVTSTIPNAQIVTVNGTAYSTDASGKARIQIPQKSTYMVAIVSPYLTGSGARAVFSNWADGATSNPRTVVMDESQTFSIITKTQYLLTLNVPSGCTSSGSGWYDSSSLANPNIPYSWGSDANARSNLVFYSIDSGSNISVTRTGSGVFTANVNMSSPHTLTFYSTIQVRLIVFGGSNVALGTASRTGDGWYDQGMSTTVSSDYVWGLVGSQSRERLRGWSLDSSPTSDVPVKDSGSFTTSPILMNVGHVVSFLSVDQFYLNVTSPFGTASGSGWYDKDSQASFSVGPTTTSAGLLRSNVFSGWSGDSTDKNSTASVLMDGSKAIVANWTVDSTPLYIAVIGAGVVAVVGVLFLRKRTKYKSSKAPTPPENEDIEKAKRDLEKERINDILKTFREKYDKGEIDEQTYSRMKTKYENQLKELG